MKKSLVALLTIVLVVLVFVYVGLNKKDDPVDNDGASLPDDTEERSESIKLVSVGDIMFHDSQIQTTDSHPSGYFFEDSMALIKPYLEEADLAIGNFESTSTPSSNYRGYPTFNSPVESLDAIKDTGFDILSTINNHTLDSGRQGVIDTYNAVVERDMIPLGTKTEPAQESLKNVERDGIKLGFLAYTYGFNGLDPYLSEEEHEYMVSSINEEKMEKEIKSSVELDNDFTIVMIHWGDEYQTSPSEEQRNLAHKMVEWGADIILGSHPHVVQEHEMIDDSFVIYSMGNFVSNQRLETLDDIETERGLMIEFTLEKNFETNEKTIAAINYEPLWVNKYPIDGVDFHQVIPTKAFLNDEISPKVPEGSEERIQSAFDDTMKRVNASN